MTNEVSFFWLTSLRTLQQQQQQQNYRNSNSNNNNSKKNIRQTTVESRESRGDFSWQASRLLLLANIGAVEPGAGLRLVLFDYAVAKGRRQSAKKAKDVVDVLPGWRKAFCTSTKSAGIRRWSSTRHRCQQQGVMGKREGEGAETDEMREQQSGPLGTIQTRANAAHNCN